MPDPASDRRTVRTKKLLRQALIELIEEKGLEGITVSDLTSRAEINRGTFYLHYKDVYDLIEQLQSEILDGLAKIASEVEFTDLIRYTGEEAYPGLVSIFEYWSRHADFCRVILGPKGEPSFAGRVRDLMKEKIYHKISAIIKAQRQPIPVPYDFILAYMTSANIGILQHWFDTGRQQSPKEVALIMTRLVSQGPIASSGLRRYPLT